MTTQLRLNAEVVCADGPAGRLTDIVLDPATEQVTHLVVEVPGYGRPRHLVPVALLQANSGREVRLRCSRAELARTEFFTETETLPLDARDARSVADGLLAFPLAFPSVATLLVEHERVPPGELAVHRDTPVEASDGRVGRLEAFVLQSNDDCVVNLIFRRGHLWRQWDVVIPATAIERIDAEAVHLRLSRAHVQTLPTRPPGTAA
jgi:sporulation protein YlmC with PRC-barrel domain